MSTLLKLLAGHIQPTVGKVKRQVEYGYFEQVEGPKDISTDPKLLSQLGSVAKFENQTRPL